MARAQLAPCRCPDCAHLDLEFPGEGTQLALAIDAPPPGRFPPAALSVAARAGPVPSPRQPECVA